MTKNQKSVVFWGATGHAKVLAEALPTLVKLIALVDNRNVVSPFLRIPIMCGETELKQWLVEKDQETIAKALYYSVAIGGNGGADRIKIGNLMSKLGMKPLTIIHKTAFVASDANVGLACQVLAQSSVCSHAVIGDHSIVNTAASVDHDTIIGAGVHIGPGAIVTGEVSVQDEVFIGAGAVILPRLTIGARSTIGAGAVVTRDVKPDTTVVGVPANLLLKQEDSD